MTIDRTLPYDSALIILNQASLMTKKLKKSETKLIDHYDSILGDISKVIDIARRSAARSVNGIMTAAYRLIGWRIVESEQAGQIRAEYEQALINGKFRSRVWGGQY